MPKEIIITDREMNRAGLDGDSPIAVQVGWLRDAHVQIATVTKDEDSDPAPVPYPGWFVDLDRDSINRLIRTLRKARDQAFGQDA